MKCPRCGFEQPEDRYCASCGADVQKFNAKPKPIWIRLLQNPNFHLTLIGMLMFLVVFYILYTQSELVSREVRTLLDLPLSSREAGEPDEAKEAVGADGPHEVVDEAPPVHADEAQFAPEAVSVKGPPAEEAKKAAPKNLELSSFEVPRETLMSLIQIADKLNEGAAGRIYYFPQGQGVTEAIQKAARKLGPARSTPLQNDAHMEMETAPTALEAFQFALQVQQSKWDGHAGQVKIEAHLMLPTLDSNTEAALPTVRQVNESILTGNSPMNAGSLVMILIDPVNRTPRTEFVQRAGDGPWSIFQSEDFREGASDWVILIQAK